MTTRLGTLARSHTFTQTGRHVDNDVRASFRFRNGLIAEHRDDFGFHCWPARRHPTDSCSAGRRSSRGACAAPAPAWTEFYVALNATARNF